MNRSAARKASFLDPSSTAQPWQNSPTQGIVAMMPQDPPGKNTILTDGDGATEIDEIGSETNFSADVGSSPDEMRQDAARDVVLEFCRALIHQWLAAGGTHKGLAAASRGHFSKGTSQAIYNRRNGVALPVLDGFAFIWSLDVPTFVQQAYSWYKSKGRIALPLPPVEPSAFNNLSGEMDAVVVPQKRLESVIERVKGNRVLAQPDDDAQKRAGREEHGDVRHAISSGSAGSRKRGSRDKSEA